MLALLVAGKYSGERLFFVGFILLCFIVLIALLSLAYGGLAFKYLQRLSPQSGVKGQDVSLTMAVHNDFWFPIPHIRLHYQTIDSQLNGSPESFTAVLLPRGHGEQTLSIHCRYRGRWDVGLTHVELEDFFGLFRLRMKVGRFLGHRPVKLLVRPRVLHIDRLPLLQRNDEGPVESLPRRSDEMAMYSDIRKYRTGDPVKRIHWKLTARHRDLMVKNYEETSLPDLLLYVDTMAHGLPRAQQLTLEDTVVECATAVVRYLLDARLPVSMVAYGKARVQLRGAQPEHFAALYNLLGELPFDGQFPMSDVLMNDLKAITRAGNLVLIIWDLGDTLFDLLMVMNTSGISITLILVYKPAQAETDVFEATARGRLERMVAAMRNAGILVIDLNAGENIAERIRLLQ